MRLKTLEIKGFKSFADKTVLQFDEGVTGVIGPNGCGKSNIIDSIRWVIGEHKISALRSENQAGLIFNGSKTRSSSGLAEVSLTFENTKNILPTEFTTVTVTRKFFKNGESEYRLNDVTCRLKDIHNLFLDTGISTDSYAIIELGMVDDIIRDKENSRRRMLEQAAGISIYKTRKKEAKSKLEATEQDLNRIEDLLFEINNNLKTLESQARKAERYYEIKKQYREVSIELAKASLEGYHDRFEGLQQQQDAELSKKAALEAEIARQEAALAQDKVDFVTKERELQDLQRRFNELVGEIRSQENEKNLNQQKLGYLREREKNLQEFLSSAGGRSTELEKSIAFSAAQVTEEQELFQGMQEELEGLQELLEEKRQVFQERKEASDDLQRHMQQVQRQQFEAEKTAAVAETSIQNQQRAIRQLEEEDEARSLQIETLNQQLQELQEALSQHQEHTDSLSRHQEETKQNILHAQSDIETLRDRMVDEARILDAKKNEYDLLKSLVDNLEGYPDSIKFLRKNPDWNSQAPILSDIFLCQEAYRTAIEGLLEPYLNYYVVDSVAEGLRAIELLDQHKKGKAHFFVLDRFSSQAQPVTSTLQGLIPALDVLEMEDKYRGLAQYLLGHVYLADEVRNLDVDFQDDRMVILQKSGGLYRGRYELAGGSVGLFEGKKLGRAKNLEKLSQEIQTLQQTVDGLKAAIQSKQQVVLGYNAQLNEQQLSRAKDQLNQMQNQQFALRNRVENFQHQGETARRRLAELQAGLEENQRQTQAVREELETHTQRLQDIQRRLAEAQSAYQTAEQHYNQANLQYNNQNLQLTRQQSKLQGLSQELEFKRKQLQDLALQVDTNREQLQDAELQIQEAGAKSQQSEQALTELFRRKEEQEKILNISDQEYFKFRNGLNERESELRLKQRAKEQVEQLLATVKDSINELKLQLASLKERLQVEFKINLDDILEQERQGETSMEELLQEADKLKKRLENMGEVNPTAIEAYQEMKKRYEFILEQKNDLVSARDSLLNTIQEVETTANQKFLDTFNQVKQNFIQVFKTLFTEEDEADMILSDPENLADTGIEIIAKPKGKRPTAITQLSGGEKTLTATALLFSIYLIKPAPFCILDEVDAPLDDANVGKFTQMIRKFSSDSQFIIVTHNKNTMAAVDVIYGVTMQEPGVSKLVPVDFRSLD